MSVLFTAVALGRWTAPNRIAVSPMCQYSAIGGMPTNWHLQNTMTLAMSGAGLVMMEATAVEERGRISHGCLGIYSDTHQAAIGKVVAAARKVAPKDVLFGIQLAHAGRKGSAQRPWEGGKPLGSGEQPWITIAPSPMAFGDGWPLPQELTTAELEAIKQAFVAAARRATAAGFDVIELHAARGYLIHQFLSPLSNGRQDAYGRAGAWTFPLAIAGAVRDAVPPSRVLGARITGTDWVEGGLTVNDAVGIAAELEILGYDYVCVSSGGLIPAAKIPVGPGYQVPFAEAVKKATTIKVRTVGMIAEATQAEEVIATNRADMIAMARAIIDDPRWPWHAAAQLGVEIARPHQYTRAAPRQWPGYTLAHPATTQRFCSRVRPQHGSCAEEGLSGAPVDRTIPKRQR
jgi:2,4-dienoyl-CoA reductase-like NADH-dependent reductase (Old Yellow Enzyme family)